MNRIKLIISLILICFLGVSCTLWGDCIEGKGPIIEKELVLDNFSRIELSGSPTVYVKQAANQKIRIKAQANLIELLNKEVSNEEWEVTFKKNCVKIKQSFEIYIEIPNIDELEINGSGEIISQGVLQADKIELNIHGSGGINADLDVKSLNTEIAGSGDIKLQGTASNHKVQINGSGNVAALDLVSDQVGVDINGSGDVKVNVSTSLDVDINGSGDVDYIGTATKISSDVNGSGELNRIK